MASISYDHLIKLLGLTMMRSEGQLRDDAVEALTYAFGVIDAANRVRVVLRSFPGLKHDAGYKVFMQATKPIESLRNIVQHINGELRNIGFARRASLGAVTWWGRPATADSLPAVWTLQPGSFYPEQRTYSPPINWRGISELREGDIAKVALDTNGQCVDLSDVVARVEAAIRTLEPALQLFSEGKELLGSDMLLCLRLRPVQGGGAERPGTTDAS